MFRINDITTTLKLSNNFSPSIFRSPLLALTADASLNSALKISLEKLPLNVKFRKLEQLKTLTSFIMRMKQKFIKLMIQAVMTTFQQWVVFWGGNHNCKILQWQWESFIASFGLQGEKCRYDLEAILTSQKLLKAREIKQAFEKELTYLFSPRMSFFTLGISN